MNPGSSPGRSTKDLLLAYSQLFGSQDLAVRIARGWDDTERKIGKVDVRVKCPLGCGMQPQGEAYNFRDWLEHFLAAHHNVAGGFEALADVV